MKRKETKSKRLILRALRSTDYKAWLEAHINRLPPQSKWDRGPMKANDCTQKIFQKVIKRHENLAKADDYYRYYIFLKKTGEIVGEIDFDIHVRSNLQTANFGYLIYNRFWGMGYGAEASALGLKIGFKNLHLNRLEAAINLDNKKSIKMAKAVGMKFEGLKKRYWFENNKWTDHIIYVANPEDIGLKATTPKRIK